MRQRLSLSQIHSKIRRDQTKQRQAIRRWNNAIRTLDNEVGRSNLNRSRAISAYNRGVRSHNALVKANRARLSAARRVLHGQTVTARYSPLFASVTALSSAYERLDSSDVDPLLSGLAGRETTNGVTVLNTLLGDGSHGRTGEGDLTDTKLSERLSKYSVDMRNRWFGAIFALNPANPDAARHFCASAREILTGILDTEAPDPDVKLRFPNCQVTEQGKPTRSSKIHYCLDRNGLNNGVLEEFIEANIKDLMVLFKDLNKGTHGPAGKFTMPQLTVIKTRVEDAIDFICEIVTQPYQT